MNIEVYHRYGYARNVSIDEVIFLLQGRSIALKFMHIYYTNTSRDHFSKVVSCRSDLVLEVGSRIPGIIKMKMTTGFGRRRKNSLEVRSMMYDVPWKPCGNAISNHHSSNTPHKKYLLDHFLRTISRTTDGYHINNNNRQQTTSSYGRAFGCLSV